MVNYYHRFLPNLAEQLTPIYNHLNNMLKQGKKCKFSWTNECQESLTKIKNELISAIFLTHPSENASYRLNTDASNSSCGESSSRTKIKERLGTYRIFLEKVHTR